MEDLKIHDNDEYVSGFSELPDNATELVPSTQTEENAASTLNEVQSNYNFYNSLQSVQPYMANGGTNNMASHKKAFLKRRKHNKMQRESRRINRKH